MVAPALRAYDLFVLNIALQLFDGVATYQGLQLGFKEANPLLLHAFNDFGPLNALLLVKAVACGLLFLMNCHSTHRAIVPAFTAAAGVYSALSLAPWLGKFTALFAHSVAGLS